MSAAALLAAALLAFQRPYHGIWHDSVLYLGQALAVLDPDIFRRDLFFAYGSQSRFTLVQYLLAPLVGWLGPNPTFLLLTALGLGLFLYASWRLLAALIDCPRLAYAALLALIVFPGSYGAWNSLSYAEPFLTGRSVAEPVALLGMAALVRGKTLVAFALLAFGAAFNPLQVLPALAATWIWLVQGDRRWLHLAWIGIMALALATQVSALQALFARMDPIWFEQVWQRNLVVFYSHSQPGDWYYLLTDIVLLALVTARARGILRRFVVSILAACLSLIAAGLLLADTVHFTWPAGLQLWRAHWLLHWTAMATLPWLALASWREPDARDRLVLLFSLTLAGVTPATAHPLVPGIAALVLAWPWLARHLSPPLRWLLASLCLAVACWHLLTIWAPQEQWRYWSPLAQWPSPLLQSWMTIVVTVLAFAGPWCWLRSGAVARGALVVAGIALLLVSTLQWDQRTPTNRAFTSAPSQPFGVDIPRDSQVQWIGGLLPTWNVLHRAHYIDQQQLAGIVFNRGTAAEGFRRKALLHVTDAAGRDCRIVTFPLEAHAACKPDLTAVRMACARTAGELDYFILPYRLPVAPLGSWSPMGPSQPGYHLYACRDLLATTGASPAAGHAGPP